MTKAEAKLALEIGEKIQHRFFSPDEWVKQYSAHRLITEDGYYVSNLAFWAGKESDGWETGWSVYGYSPDLSLQETSLELETRDYYKQ